MDEDKKKEQKEEEKIGKKVEKTDNSAEEKSEKEKVEEDGVKKKEEKKKKDKSTEEKEKGEGEGEKNKKEDESEDGLMKGDGRGDWYVVHTYSGHENKASTALQQRVAAMKLENKIFEVVIPTRKMVRVKRGQKEEQTERIFPGYIIVRMDLDDNSWLAVRTTPGVTSFVGAGQKPMPISNKEVEAIKRFMSVNAPKFKTKFSVGEAVKINDGPFTDFLGSIESIDHERGKLKVLVSIFGRETPVELDFLQVSKL